MNDLWGLVHKQGLICVSTWYQITIRVEEHRLHISRTLLTQSKQRDKEKLAVTIDPPWSGYNLLGLFLHKVSYRSTHLSKERQADFGRFKQLQATTEP